MNNKTHHNTTMCQKAKSISIVKGVLSSGRFYIHEEAIPAMLEKQVKSLRMMKLSRLRLMVDGINSTETSGLSANSKVCKSLSGKAGPVDEFRKEKS